MTSHHQDSGWIRLSAGGALAGVSIIAFIVSYLHGLYVVELLGTRPPVAWLLPVLADLVIAGASAKLYAAAKAGTPKPRPFYLVLTVGIGVTLAMNVAAGLAHGVPGALVAGWPAVAFILALWVLETRIPAPAVAGGGEGAIAKISQCPHVAAIEPVSLEDQAVTAYRHANECLRMGLSIRMVAATFGIDRNKLGALLKPVEQSANGHGPQPVEVAQ